ncbi:lipid-A-disaccharide kinase [Rhodopseudomonas thermotolerans]|uniref:Tetraacyldisaccharide 4'-kinase n=2 Tax=Rhodopseudomonas TaxID=1073 RepID=A0A336JLD0_9BRAD|nr:MULTISPECIES: tetraacyldisaccharide 4'-kinase [Rhodopseudomonas]RED37541.1 lipid-A-disaccharide kinase [Rhodopseudomonas pentothenatexigens]REG04027.1 lipid-A-disaccharide kinase [Rhodopseudomonas thermotolerans]SSW90508.1 lipid-A-disaccharide kinase [Rhodopseudomonas pentothenatexigens]
MREPGFWHRPPSLASRLLLPIAAIYGNIAATRMQKAGTAVGVPVLCVGNYHMGGAGKTPTTLALVALLRELGETPVVLSRGYGGQLHGPVVVDPSRHSAADVGDEPLMMARRLPVVVARNRTEGAALAASQGATVILMDDGFQNPALIKDAALVVIDSRRGVGNGSVFPAGPLRAPLALQIARTDALVVVGDGTAADVIAAQVAERGAPVLRARLVPEPASVEALRGRRVLAFAGIGDPARFVATLQASGIEVVEQRAYPDHHPFTAEELGGLAAAAKRDGLSLVTTEKDLARIGSAQNALGVDVVPFAVTLAFEDEGKLRLFLLDRLNGARAAKLAKRR